MDKIFYFFSALAIIYECKCLIEPQEVIRFKKTFKDTEARDYTETQKVFAFCQLFYFLWAFVGLFSSQWVPFLALFMLSILSSIIKENVVCKVADAALTMAILFFIIINKYQLHYTGSEIINFFR